ncbi:hypothetical protein PV11_02943 [Exophiala sideris]|uniref:Major facilitator superfamily (MFS) profile domain-containing protein n=1 Tax=Exophiala sideris TaxID=1016849 RepID=A0A0D1Z0N3_9EURO|nr:hypothetical protein PV11_02943 [Exophiala sideris]
MAEKIKHFLSPNDKELSTTDKEASFQAGEVDIVDESAQSLLYTQAQHALGFWEAVRLYPTAILWSLLINVAIILKGFDGALVGSVVGLAPFQRQFGYEYEGSWVISAAWNGAFNYANSIGGVFGALFAGWVYDRVGPRMTLLICSFLSIAFIFMEFFAETAGLLFAGELLNGIVIAFYPVVGSAYIGEVCPLVLRGVAGSMINLGFVVGQLISSGLLKGTNSLDSKWAYKAPYAAEWAPPLIVLFLVIFCPNSPWWLCRRGKYAEAEKALKRLAKPEVDVTLTMANIKHTLRMEEQLEKNHNYLDCFRGPDLRRLIIACMVYCIQPLSGQVLYVSYAVQFFEHAGLDASNAFSMNIGLTGFGFLATIASWVIISKVGRRPIYMYGTGAVAFVLLIIGILDVVPNRNSGVTWGQSALMLVCIVLYDLTIGPACFTVLCEVASARLRGMTIGLATCTCHILNIIFGVAIPYAMDTDEGNWKGKLGFLFAGIAALCVVWCYFCLPETKDKTFEELDVLFEERVDSRRFTTHVIRRSDNGDPEIHGEA